MGPREKLRGDYSKTSLFERSHRPCPPLKTEGTPTVMHRARAIVVMIHWWYVGEQAIYTYIHRKSPSPATAVGVLLELSLVALASGLRVHRNQLGANNGPFNSSGLVPAAAAVVVVAFTGTMVAPPNQARRSSSTSLSMGFDFKGMMEKMSDTRYARVRHILVEEKGEEGRSKLEAAKAEIAGDLDKFSEVAEAMSTCTSAVSPTTPPLLLAACDALSVVPVLFGWWRWCPLAFVFERA